MTCEFMHVVHTPDLYFVMLSVDEKIYIFIKFYLLELFWLMFAIFKVMKKIVT